MVFDQGFGDLFVIRVAGNVVAQISLNPAVMVITAEILFLAQSARTFRTYSRFTIMTAKSTTPGMSLRDG